MRQLFDRLPAGVLIYRLDQLLYANPAFLRAVGHRYLDELIEAGGLDTLFLAPDSTAADAAPGKPFALTLDPAGRVRIEAELIPVHWESEFGACAAHQDARCRCRSAAHRSGAGRSHAGRSRTDTGRTR